jgi:acyl-CoA thioesterase FadM
MFAWTLRTRSHDTEHYGHVPAILNITDTFPRNWTLRTRSRDTEHYGHVPTILNITDTFPRYWTLRTRSRDTEHYGHVPTITDTFPRYWSLRTRSHDTEHYGHVPTILNITDMFPRYWTLRTRSHDTTLITDSYWLSKTTSHLCDCQVWESSGKETYLSLISKRECVIHLTFVRFTNQWPIFVRVKRSNRVMSKSDQRLSNIPVVWTRPQTRMW